MLDLTPDQRRELEALQRSYRSELAERLARVAEAADALRIGRKDRPGLHTLRHLTHRLAGSAGICGFTALGEAASRIEEVAIAAARAGAVTVDLVAELRRLSNALRKASRHSTSIGRRSGATHRRAAARVPGRRRTA
jgi:HPt (histidine-containing phosphotransfer) domain-containing protein